MHIPRVFIGVLLLLADIGLSPRLSSETTAEPPRKATQVLQNQCEAGCRSGPYERIFSLLTDWDGEFAPVAVTESWAQNRPPSATDPEQATSDEKLDLSEQLTRDVFEPLQRGIQGHNLDQVLSIFDRQQMSDYAQLSDQLRAFFEQYDAIRFRYQLLQATSKKSQATAVAEIAMDANPLDPSQVTLRREIQMRFRMTLGAKGWKLVGFTPADFFAK
jgi:hypothetical protein